MRRWVLAIAAATGCLQETASFDVADTSGAPFRWTCGEHCVPEAIATTPPFARCQASTTPIYAWSIGRFIVISSACAYADGSWTSSSNRERPLACEATADCPELGGAHGSFECRDRVCQNADVEQFPPGFVDESLAFTLCYAPIPREETLEFVGDAQQRVSDAVTAACASGPCGPLPDTCLQL